MNKNQVENSQESVPEKKKDGRANNGWKKGFTLNRPKPAATTKSKRIPIELLDSVDRLIQIHHKKATNDGRSHRIAGAQQQRTSSKSEVREVPLDLIDFVVSLVAAWRSKHGVGRTRHKKSD